MFKIIPKIVFAVVVGIVFGYCGAFVALYSGVGAEAVLVELQRWTLVGGYFGLLFAFWTQFDIETNVS